MSDEEGEIIAPITDRVYSQSIPVNENVITDKQRQEAEKNAKAAVASIAKISTHIKTEKKMIGGKQMDVVEEWIGNPKQENLYVGIDDPDIE